MKTSKSFINGVKMVLAATTVSLAMTSCLNDGDTSYAYISGVSTDCYANSNTVYLVYQSSSAWQIQKGSDAPWLTVSNASGQGPAMGSAVMTTEFNNTDKYRTATVSLTNADGKSSSAQLYQWGTRGDGSLGTAREVRRITGTDGSEITFLYSNKRIASLNVSKNGKLIEHYMFSYPTLADTARIMSVYMTVAEKNLKTSVNFGWQPTTDIADDNKTELVTWTSTSSNNASVKWNENTDRRNVQTVMLSGYENPDSELSNSQLKYSYSKDGIIVDEYFTISHTEKMSNRKQTVDANQLIFGVERMNPFMLLGFYRYARCAYLYEKAEDTSSQNKCTYTVKYTRNTDETVNTMTVEREDGSSVTYTFEY